MSAAGADTPQSTYQHLVFHSRVSVWVICLLVLLGNTLLYLAMGTWQADLSAMDIHSRTELFGLLLLMILMPVWLLGCFIVTQRHTLMLAQQLEQQFSLDQQLGEQVTYLPGRQVSMGITSREPSCLLQHNHLSVREIRWLESDPRPG